MRALSHLRFRLAGDNSTVGCPMVRKSGYEAEKKLPHTTAIPNPNEIKGLGKSDRPREIRRDLRVLEARSKTGSKSRALVARGITGGSFWFFHFRPGYEV